MPAQRVNADIPSIMIALCQPITLSFKESGAIIVTIDELAAGIRPAGMPRAAEHNNAY